MFSKSIRIYLADGAATGLRHAEIVNWTGQAMAVPRGRIAELSEWKEVQRPGIYFLFGSNEGSFKPSVYIGESENIYNRLKQQLRQKDFWNVAVACTSKDDNLTKGHIRFLESRAIKQAREANRYIVVNENNPQLPGLPRSDQDSMEEFLANVRVLLGTLGHRVMEPLLVPSQPATTGNEVTLSDELFFEAAGFLAKGIQIDEGFLVLKDSQISANISSSLTISLKDLREDANHDGLIEDIDGKYIIQENMLFGSSSYAASFVAGNSRNGRTSWKNGKGQTLKELEEKGLEINEASN